MQIKKVKISNVLSFPYLDNFNEHQEVSFDTESNGNINILIGPNGAGKSNFLLIINDILKIGLTRDYIYKPEIITDDDKLNFKNVIISNEMTLKKIFKHFGQQDKPSKVLIGIKLNNHDIENIGFIMKYKGLFQNIFKKYSDITLNLGDIDTQRLSENKYIDIIFNIDTDNNKVTVDTSNLSKEQILVIEYLKNIELIQIGIMIQNQFHYPQDKIKFYPLKNTFGSIGVHRKFAGLSTKINPKLWNAYISQKDTIEYKPFIGYYLCINKIRNIINHTSDENISKKQNIKDLTIENIEKKVEESKFYSSLKGIIQKYFSKKLCIGKDNDELYLYIIDSLGQVFKFEDLSDGEQSLLTIIFAIYGFDIKDGAIMIDEPEIHAHPQMQRSFIRMLQKISKNLGTQFIISTYSPLFINERNISNVYKFSKIQGETKIINPGNLTTDEGTLIQMLKLENASKIFFSKKIIMVEGETDAYFFEFYLNYLHTFQQWKDKITDYEIININGKGGFQRWKSFLSKFGIQSYFIGDRDNTVEFNILEQADLNYYYQQSKKYYNSIKKVKGHMDRHYTRLVNTIRALHPDKHSYVVKKIEELYQENIFILKKGDIETYLGMKSKGLEETINFCHRDFQKRLSDKSVAPHREELNYTINAIFS
ncbi:MAG: AAA family ATPase [Candidatus Absconditicoccaceae bacterium]